MTKVLCAAIAVAVLAGTAAGAGGVGFATKPAAVRDDGKVTIAFTVSGPTDASVEIVGPNGRIVRHLGAAALGAKSPPPPFRPGLAQEIPWDGNDDAGKPAAGGPFTVRVRLGLSAQFDRFIGWQKRPPLDCDLINGLAVAADRTVYVIGISRCAPAAGRSENRIWAMSPDGEYLKTLYPFPATMDPQKLPGVDFLSTGKDRLEPRIYDRVCISTLPQMRAVNRQTMAITSDGRLVFTNGWGTELYFFGPRCLMLMKTDGSIPRERIDGPAFGTEKKAGYTHLGLSPDQKTVYLTAVKVDLWGKDENVVYRVGLGVGDKPEVVFGTLGKPAAGPDGLNEPRGLAVDGKGRVYVSDFGNDRIAVLEPTGKYVGEIPLKGPGVLCVHPKTGAIYAISMPAPRDVYKLVRIAGPDKPAVEVELDLTRYGGVVSSKTHIGYHPVMALDPYADKPILYVGNPQTYGGYRLLRIVDNGASLAEQKIDLSADGGFRGLPYPQGIGPNGDFFFRGLGGAIDYDRLIGSHVFRADSGRIEPTGLRENGVIGKDGLLYYGIYQGHAVKRMDPSSGKVMPFFATGEWSEPYNESWRFYDRRSSWHVVPSGDIWAFAADDQEKPYRGVRVVALGPDGKIRRKDIVVGLQGPSSLRADSRGSIYVADGLTLDGRPYPPEIDAFARRLRAAGTTQRGWHSEAVEDSYGEAYGSILKFAPEGGQIRKLAAADTAAPGETLLSAYPYRVQFAAKGLLGTYGRISPMSPPRYDYDYSACWCLFAIFDIDAHDRLFVPDAMQFRVRVLDANFNEILTFGGYDQATDKGGEANAPRPEIPLEFPTYVHAGDGAAYVTDTAPCARRIVRVKLGCAAEETCTIP
jgi:hypothetical protein